jgi:hypothetical protein
LLRNGSAPKSLKTLKKQGLFRKHGIFPVRTELCPGAGEALRNVNNPYHSLLSIHDEMSTQALFSASASNRSGVQQFI